MRRSPLTSLCTVTSLGLCLLLHTITYAEPTPSTTQAPVAPKRWVSFDIRGSHQSGDVPIGKPLELSMTLGGLAQTSLPVMAICESTHFQSQIVTMEPNPSSSTMNAIVTLIPIPQGKFSVSPKVTRIQVTVARSQSDKKFDRLLTRAVYITLGNPEPTSDTAESPLPNREEARSGEAAVEQEEIQPDVVPIASGPVVEEDLVPLPSPERSRAYWQQVSHLVSKSWSRTVRRVRHSPTSETVRVRFRLYPGGRAQLIQIEKGSGAREVDEAGIHAIVHAQPFPPFPDDMGSEPVNVHVRMRTGAKAGVQAPQTVGNPQTADHPPASLKK